jgi:uncharacterized damage-inducible protein DinB
MTEPLGSLVLAECKRHLFQESLPRLKKCLSELSEEEIWYRPNSETVSAGNLVLHLCGNVRQWIVSTLGRTADNRKRQTEFDEWGPIPTSELLERLESTLAEAESVIDKLEHEALTGIHRVQGMEETGVAILIHVVEHFSYHTGQISYITKSNRGIDLGYYRGVDLGKHG